VFGFVVRKERGFYSRKNRRGILAVLMGIMMRLAVIDWPNATRLICDALNMCSAIIVS
jgi:hypothetical protein